MESLETPGKLAIEWLSDFIHHFPTTAEIIRDVAMDCDFDHVMLRFLDLFSDKEKFYSRADFINRCTLLANIIREEQEAQKEFLLGSQE